jgi:type II secretory pathway pseudopilin PulG
MMKMLNEKMRAKTKGFRRSRQGGVSRNRGFTLMEILIASSLLILVLALTMSALNGYTKSSNREITMSGLEDDQRSALARIQKELTGASKVIASTVINTTTYTTSGNTIVFQVPIYNKDGFIMTDSSGAQEVDTVVIQAVSDSTNYLSLRTTPTSARKLQIFVTTAVDSIRTNLSNQTVLKNLMPEDGSAAHNYTYPQALNPAPSAVPIFQYLDANDAVTTDMTQVAGVRIQLWSEQQYNNMQITANKQFEIRLRNWTPTPTPT